MNQGFDELKSFLDAEAKRINSVDFIHSDPVQFPRRFDKLQDVEIVAWLSASIAWGNRKMICRNCEKMLQIMENEPLNYVLEGDWEQLPDQLNIHRTYFARNFKYAMRGFREIMSRWGSLDAFAASQHVGEHATPSWLLVERMQQVFADANGGALDSQCMPTKLDSTALKRVNMALRWLVRRDGIVDMGLWESIKPSQLFIPLDVHVGNVARSLGLLSRKANDKKSVIELTEQLRRMRPDDPVIYDYALFGIGIETSQAGKKL